MASLGWQLAIQTSGREGSLALLNGEHLIRTYPLSAQLRTAAAIGQAMQEALRALEQAGDHLEFVSVAVGPGSFTGLRIGVTAAKTLAYALDCPVVAIDTLQVIAAQSFPLEHNTCKLMVASRAYRQQVFTRTFTDKNVHSGRSEVMSESNWLATVASLPAGSVIAGDAIDTLRKQVDAPQPERAGKISNAFTLVPAFKAQPQAATVGRLAANESFFRTRCGAFELLPRYLRPSAAEEKRKSAEHS